MFFSDKPSAEQIFNGTRFQFLILSRAAAKTFTATTPYLIISVTDPEKPDAELSMSPCLRAVWRMKFHDAAPPNRIAAQFATDNSEIYLTASDAARLVLFVREHLAAVKLLVCQCEQGISRSAAIAAALSRILQDQDEFFFRHYWVNRYVYDVLLEQAEKFSFFH